MKYVFHCKQLYEDGTSSDRLLINEEFILLFDYSIAITLSAKSTDAEEQWPCYLERVAPYKALDRQEGLENAPS